MKPVVAYKPGNVLWVLLLLLPVVVRGQAAVQERLSRYTGSTLQEKLFVHLDRPLYVVGETLWFKTYCIDASTHRPLDVSKIAYLEVLDKESNPVVQIKIALDKGRGDGSVRIPATLPAGTYTVRSYTNWMKNFSPDLFFEAAITILNPFERPEAEPLAGREEPAYEVQFFPEGGHLVSQLESKVAFRAVGKDGKGIACRGVIVNQNNDTLVRFQPLRFGMGQFTFTPGTTDKYRAIVRDIQDNTLIFPLPEVQPRGYVMQVRDSTDGLVQVTVSAREVPSPDVYLLVHTRQGAVQSQAGTLKNGKAVFVLNKNRMSDASLKGGITHITLFDHTTRPVCERLYFTRPAQPLVIRESLNKAEFTTRERVYLNLSARTEASLIEPAQLSVSVYLLDSLPHPEPPTLDSYLLLTSDLKGTVESPSYYFQRSGPEVNQALDNLMLTHGWSRFSWDEVLADTPPTYRYLPEHGGHFIEGKVVNTLTGQPARLISTYLAAPSPHPRLFVSLSDPQGTIRFEIKKLYDAHDVIVQTNTRRDSTYRIELFSPYSDQVSSRRWPSFLQSKAPQLLTRSINMQTQNAYYPTPAARPTAEGTDSLAFYGKPDEKYFLDAFTRFPTLEEVMREYVPGVFVRKQRGKFHFYVVNKLLPQGGTFNEDPLILLDGVPVFDTDKMMAIDPLQIKKLEVMNGQYYLGKLSFPGIVSYTTYKGDMAGFQLDPRALVLSYSFAQSRREFYAPRYDSATSRESRLPDFRNLLHWAPMLTTDAEGKQVVDFFTSDQTGTYQVVVQGLTESGTAGSRQFTFVVKPGVRQ
ncbi:MG2 domain-containing protein [Telluribacter humicola]|uniref:MG2 domain-containing protein n=1 Tax=Telluribacter humicola TaxID=1720261 RepID=UPI001A97C5DE|nr:MG2 domain-containing protein [Telluribacter humicola]